MALAININDLLNKQKIESNGVGRSTIQAKLAENGSPRAVFETTDDRLTFLVTLPIHEGCSKSSERTMKSSERSSGTQPESSGTRPKSSGTIMDMPESRRKTCYKILDLIRNNPKITAPQIAMDLELSTRGIEKNLRLLRESGILCRIGSPTYGGYWEIKEQRNS